MILRILVFACLSSGCVAGGGGCGGRKPEPAQAKKAKKPPPEAVEADLVEARAYLFPPASATSKLKFDDGRTLSIRYTVTKDGKRETIRRSGGGAFADSEFQAGGSVIAAKVGNRSIEISDRIGVGDAIDDKFVTNVGMTIETPAGTFSPCLRALAKQDKDGIIRSVDYYCRGKGLVMIEKVQGTKVERAALVSP